MEEVGLTVKECAGRLEVTPNNLSRPLNGRIGISARVALGLESVGWSNAKFWMRLYACYDLGAQACRWNSVPKGPELTAAGRLRWLEHPEVA